MRRSGEGPIESNGLHQDFSVKDVTARLLNFDIASGVITLRIAGAHARPEGRLPQQQEGTFSCGLKELSLGVGMSLPRRIDLVLSTPQKCLWRGAAAGVPTT
jgi:hypothetical protein